MKTANLSTFVDKINLWDRHFNPNDTITFPLDQAAVDRIIWYLETELSPENLHCDGEISHAEANRKHAYFMKVYRELVDYCKTHNLTAHNLRV